MELWACIERKSKANCRFFIDFKNTFDRVALLSTSRSSCRVHVVEQVLGEYNNLKKLNDFLEGSSLVV